MTETKAWPGEAMGFLLNGNRPPRNDAEDRFVVFFHDNPKLWVMFNKFAHDLVKAGKRRYGAFAVINRIRWEYDIATISDDYFKISNGVVPYYARLWMDRNPQYGNFFCVREIKIGKHRGRAEAYLRTRRPEAAE